MPQKKEANPQERRQYIRLDYVFPVGLYLKGRDAPAAAAFIQAFTRDVSLGGLCLTVNNPSGELLAAVKNAGSSFAVSVEVPFAPKPIDAQVKPAWHEIVDRSGAKTLIAGLSYTQIDDRDRRRIVSRARRMKWMPVVGMAVIASLTLLLAGSFAYSYFITEQNRALINRFYKAQETSDVYKRGYEKIEGQYDILRQEQRKSAEAVEALTAELKTAPADKQAAIRQALDAALAEKTLLDEKIAAIRTRKEKTESLLTEAKETRREAEEAAVKNMLQWLSTHQVKQTGLVLSFEGDPAVKDWAFTYDQALASQAFLIFNKPDRAIAVLSFYKDRALRKDAGFLNAYNARSGSPSEDVVHMGPSLWLGIAAAQYTHRTGDRQFLAVAEEIAKWAIAQKDAEGGMKGGPGITWYSTEHNLDAYALFTMLYQITKNDLYRKEAASTLAWIKANTYSKKDGAMKRGKGDGTIATDTFAWAIAAIGPETLAAQEMDPDGIMAFAEEQCRITTSFARPGGEVVEVTGFDFAKARNAPRGGVISTEWTAQMAMAFKIMAGYHADREDSRKSEEYRKKAEFYLGELDKLLIASPSPSGQGAGCLPYATVANADTGHGWRTPAGSSTGSVAGTAYTIFAKKGYNPLALE